MNEPTLCIFEDMTAFIPWNAQGHPFKENRVFDTNNGFFRREPDAKQNTKTEDSSLMLQ